MGIARDKKLKERIKEITVEKGALQSLLDFERSLHSDTMNRFSKALDLLKTVKDKNLIYAIPTSILEGGEEAELSEEDSLRVLNDLLKIKLTPVAALALLREMGIFLYKINKKIKKDDFLSADESASKNTEENKPEVKEEE